MVLFTTRTHMHTHTQQEERDRRSSIEQRDENGHNCNLCCPTRAQEIRNTSFMGFAIPYLLEAATLSFSRCIVIASGTVAPNSAHSTFVSLLSLPLSLKTHTLPLLSSL